MANNTSLTVSDSELKAMREEMDRQYHQIAGAGASGLFRDPPGGWNANTRTVAGAQTSQAKTIAIASHRLDMIAMRLRVAPDLFPFKNFGTFLQGDTVYVVVVLPAGPTMLEDNADLFPSDTLMSQLRLLLP